MLSEAHKRFPESKMGLGTQALRGIDLKRLLIPLIALIVVSQALQGLALSSQENQLLSGLNAERAVNGLPPLTLNAVLSEVARRYCNDMIAYGFFDHISAADGSNPYQRVERSGYYEGYSGPRMVAENLGLTSGGVDVEFMLREWMGSPDHRANILNTQMNEVGVGIAQGTYRNNPNTALYTVVFAYRTRAAESATPSLSTQTWASRTTIRIRYYSSSKVTSSLGWTQSTRTVISASTASTPREILKSSTVLFLQKTKTTTILTPSSSRLDAITTTLAPKPSSTLRSTTLLQTGGSQISTLTVNLRYSPSLTQPTAPPDTVALPGFSPASIIIGLLVFTLSLYSKKQRRS
ncbi:MAG: CAP domain-containing protein [Candidatus Bathyarchaeia archaeon]